jgi:hypothetical protein
MLLLLLNNFGASKAQKDSQSVNKLMKRFLSDAFREDLNAVVFLQPISQMPSNERANGVIRTVSATEIIRKKGTRTLRD